MLAKKSLPTSTLFVVVVLGLAGLGVAYGLWSKSLFIQGVIQTGSVNARFIKAFTDDDDKVDDTAKDSLDREECVDLGGVDQDGDGLTSCDPARSGRDPKPHWDKDVARCDAEIDAADGSHAKVTKTNVYPGYFCTAWFDIVNSGTIPVKIARATVNGVPVIPSVPTPFDLNGDGVRDVAIHLTDIQICQQIEPGQIVQMDIDQRILQGAPQGTKLSYVVEVMFQQWNEPCEPAQPTLPLFNVTQRGLTQAQATGLAAALGIPASQFAYRDGVALFADPVGYQRVPMMDLGMGTSEDGGEVMLQAFDLAAIAKIQPMSDEAALGRTQKAFDETGIIIQGQPMVAHSFFDVFAADGTPQLQDVALDTQVMYEFELGGVPLTGPGAKVNVTFEPNGQVSQLMHSLLMLSPGDTVPIIPQEEARKRCEMLYPGMQVQTDPSLLYWAASPMMPDVSQVGPYYNCGGSAPTRTGDVFLLEALIPATDNALFTPAVHLDVSVEGNSIMAQATVDGGMAPYHYSWSSSSTDLSGIGMDQSSIQYQATPREGVATETVHVLVTDANGVQVQATQTVNLTPVIGLLWPTPLKVTARPLSMGGVVDFGIERAVSDLGGPEANGYSFRMSFAAFKRFHWTGLSAWERDFKQSPPWATGLDHLYVDNVDETFYVGHGSPANFTFESSQDDGSIVPADVTNAWGNLDEEWMAILSCRVCDAATWWQWGQAFNGLHLMTCFQTLASANTNIGYVFADWQLGRFFFLPPQTVRASWLLAALQEQPSGRQAVVMGVIGPNGLADYWDYFHGKGSVGPDIPRSSIVGYWRVVVTVP